MYFYAALLYLKEKQPKYYTIHGKDAVWWRLQETWKLLYPKVSLLLYPFNFWY